MIWEYNKILKNARNINVEEAIKEITKIILTIYAAALDLPNININNDSEEEEFTGEIFDEEAMMDEKFTSCRNELREFAANLSEIYATLNIINDSWYEYQYKGGSLIGELTLNGLAQTLDQWRFYFFAEYDWGIGNM